MTEKEKCTDEALKNCIQEAYGLSDEQLLAELEELEASLSDDEFVGAEDRIYNKIKERENERSSEPSEMVVPSEAPASSPISIRKISKKKKLLVVGIAAVLAVGAGVNAIGGNNYFLRRDESKESIVLDSGQNVIKVGDLQDAYEVAKISIEIPLIRMNYIPKDMKFKELQILDGNIIFIFSYKEEMIYLIQSKKENEISVGINSDRKTQHISVKNAWLNLDIDIVKNPISNDRVEYSLMINREESRYRVVGVLPEDEIIEIARNLNFN